MLRTVLVTSSTKSTAENCLQSSKKLVSNLTAKSYTQRLFNNAAASATISTINKKYLLKNETKLTRNSLKLTKRQNVRFFSASNLPSHIKVTLPALSPTMEMGTIVSWEKEEGDRLSEGDLLAEIETDKATMGFETPEEGYLAKILIPAGEKNVPLGKLLCIIVENQEDIAAFKDYAPTAEDNQATGKKPAPSTSSAPTNLVQPSTAQKTTVTPVKALDFTPPAQSGGRIIASPLARSLAAAKGIDLSLTKGTGPNGRIIANDLQNAQTLMAGLSESAAAMSSSYRDLESSAIRQTIAKRLSLSKQTIPHYHLTVEIEIDQLLKIREQMNNMLAKDNVKLSLNDFIIKAAALACKQVPETNSSWQDTFIRQYNDVDISIAVNTDAGLITLILFKANEIGVKEISQRVKNLATKARDGNLQSNDYQGGTFTISNLGMLGIDNFSGIINPPQSCVLAVGTVEQRVVPNSDPSSVDKLKITNLLKVTLSCDHRTVDGAVGAKWLSVYKNYLQNPFTMIL